jgi:nicotinate phosphoribosyltransferase
VTSPVTTEPALLTDLYELAMLSAYYELGMEETAAFEFSIRRLPAERSFLVAAGLEQVLDYVESLRFTQDDLAWLDSTGLFKPEFLDRLSGWRFCGDIEAMPEGTICFADEPIVRVVAPLPQAQLLETRLINLLHFQTLIASKAARCRLVAGGRTLVDFGMRRAHGAEAALLAARASYIAGFDATSNVEAARRFEITCSGTMAHSFIQAHDREIDAFRAFAKSRPHQLTLLIDTYNTALAAERVVGLARELANQGIRIANVRIDSGDLAEEASRVRAILDSGGCHDIGIFASGGIDEHAIAAFVEGGVPMSGFGVGTALTASTDAAALDCAYKLQEYAGRPRRKGSTGKATWPGRRQVYRRYDDAGKISRDVVTSMDERVEGKQLLQPVMRQGRRTTPVTALAEIRSYCARELASLPPGYADLKHAPASPVSMSRGLRALADELERTGNSQAHPKKEPS